ncbi:syntaxin-8 [Reticulomyxa filosa]|uniref:Syntaxin-8 n=1 Tax=Reticulomyxa filosa TaxID=46433 RepID=X6LAE6_RETFI|nr:syntaxin-8 [Reticulomyxa filosa]|eukprot:ETN98106.1 syntaxin-8 [Reticulomyxa filosa]
MSAQDWMREYEELNRLTEAAKNDIISMQLAERKNQREAMLQFKRNAKTQLKQVAERLPQLKADLADDPQLSPEERKRRSQKLKNLSMCYRQKTKIHFFYLMVCGQIGQDYNAYRDQLESKVKKFGGRDGLNPSETDTTQSLSNQEIKQLHEDKIRQQDEHLDEILQGTKKVREIGHDINSELERQNVVLDDIDNEMGKASSKIENNNKRVEFLLRKSKDISCCCLMLVLFIAIIVLIFW